MTAPDWSPYDWGSAPESDPDLTRLFRDGVAINAEGSELETWVRYGGSISVTSGKLVVSDLDPDVTPLPVIPAKGDYPVWVATWDSKVSGPRNLAAVLLLSDETPVAWRKVGAFVVESGLAAFGDLETIDRFHRRDLDDEFSEGWATGNGIALEYLVRPGSTLRPRLALTAFATGIGEGVYAVYLGRNTHEDDVAVAVGFGLVRGDRAEESDVPERPSAGVRRRAEFLTRFDEAVYGARRFSDASTLAELFDPFATLHDASGVELATGAEAVAITLLRHLPPGPVELRLDRAGSHPSQAVVALIVRRYPRVSVDRGRILLEFEEDRALGVRLVGPFEESEEQDPLPPRLPPPADAALIQRLEARELTHLQQVFVKDLRARVSVGEPLTAGQRARAENLLT